MYFLALVDLLRECLKELFEPDSHVVPGLSENVFFLSLLDIEDLFEILANPVTDPFCVELGVDLLPTGLFELFELVA